MLVCLSALITELGLFSACHLIPPHLPALSLETQSSKQFGVGLNPGETSKDREGTTQRERERREGGGNLTPPAERANTDEQTI